VVTDYDSVRLALGTAIQKYEPGLNVYYYVPKSLVPPAAIIKPQSQNVRTIEYAQAHGGSSLAKWHFQVLFVIGQLDEAAAESEAGALISPGSRLVRSLSGRLSTGFSQVLEGGISAMMFDQGLYTYAQLTVSVLA
jgi:hypothetical protein